MSRKATASINLNKINEEFLFTSKKGEKHLNLVIWFNDEPDNYGNDFSIQQQIGKSEKRIYIGNGKYYDKTPDDRT